jgi:UDP-glucose 4-epimerase
MLSETAGYARKDPDMLNRDLKVLAGKQVLVTGGLGFIGSNLAIRLVELGAQVTLLDAMIPGHGGNLFNIETVKDDVAVNFSDIRDEHTLNYIVRGKDYVFHLAGQNDHILSQTNPYPDIDINIKGSVVLLEACRRSNPDARLVYTGTRGEYGSVAKLPAREDAPINPKGLYELSSLTAQKVFKIYNDNHGIRNVTLRITNVYGPRAQMQHSRFGVANWFVRQAIGGDTITVYGDGRILRDFVYVDDCVSAILASACTEDAYGEVINVGSDAPSSFGELAEVVVDEAGCGKWELAPFAKERALQEPGDFYSDITKIRRLMGWEPTTPLREGIRRTVDFYQLNKEHYW